MPAAPIFNQAAINGIFEAVESTCLQLGRFEAVNRHEPKSAPANGLDAAVWVNAINPLKKRSALNAISGVLSLRIRIYTPYNQQPYDSIDPNVITTVSELMAAFSGDFDFGAEFDVRCIDVFGGEGSGESLNAQAGYMELDRKIYRIMTVVLPVVVNDMWMLVE